MEAPLGERERVLEKKEFQLKKKEEELRQREAAIAVKEAEWAEREDLSREGMCDRAREVVYKAIHKAVEAEDPQRAIALSVRFMCQSMSKNYDYRPGLPFTRYLEKMFTNLSTFGALVSDRLQGIERMTHEQMEWAEREICPAPTSPSDVTYLQKVAFGMEKAYAIDAWELVELFLPIEEKYIHDQEVAVESLRRNPKVLPEVWKGKVEPFFSATPLGHLQPAQENGSTMFLSWYICKHHRWPYGDRGWPFDAINEIHSDDDDEIPYIFSKWRDSVVVRLKNFEQKYYSHLIDESWQDYFSTPLGQYEFGRYDENGEPDEDGMVWYGGDFGDYPVEQDPWFEQNV